MNLNQSHAIIQAVVRRSSTQSSNSLRRLIKKRRYLRILSHPSFSLISSLFELYLELRLLINSFWWRLPSQYSNRQNIAARKKAFKKSLLIKKTKTIKIRWKRGLIFSSQKSWLNQSITWFSYLPWSHAVIKNLKKFSKKVQHHKDTLAKKWPFAPKKRRRGRPPKKTARTPLWIFKRGSEIFTSHLKLTFAFLLIGTGLAASGYFYVTILKDLPSPDELIQRDQIVTTRILDRHGELLYRIYEDENRTLISLSDLPQHTIQATLAIEDKDFYSHHGFSVRGITRAALANSQGLSTQGGSTITQQLVKNRLLSSERTWERKVKELILSVLVDYQYSKEDILEMYFNTVPYGGATYGIEEAAQTFFGKSARELTLAQSTILAGLPAAPSAYSPFGPNPELAYARQDEVLRRMIEDGYISLEQAQNARQEDLQLRTNMIDINAPHFVMYIRDLLAKKYGEAAVNQGGLEVLTTLDLPLQNQAQKIVTDEVNSLERLQVHNGAALVTNPQTGEILAMVGSKDYFDFEHDGQVNVTLRPRQPGSSIKPLTYATALSLGKTPYSLINDSPITYFTPGSKPYSPKNYDGRYHGRVTIKEALASSYNIPAVKTLAEVGIQTVINQGERMGISTWTDHNRFGLSLTLGGGEILMTDMAELYSTFANYGYTVDLNPILQVRDSHGNILYRNSCALDGVGCPRRQNLDPRVAYQITNILSDNAARSPAFGTQSVLHIPGQEVAVKTGTTNNLRDNWTFGYTQNTLVSVWVGNNDNQSMSYVASGITGASPIWNKIMRLTLSEDTPHRFVAPDGLIKVSICGRTGTLNCSNCPNPTEAYFIPGTEPKYACNAESFKQPDLDPNRDRILQGQQF